MKFKLIILHQKNKSKTRESNSQKDSFIFNEEFLGLKNFIRPFFLITLPILIFFILFNLMMGRIVESLFIFSMLILLLLLNFLFKSISKNPARVYRISQNIIEGFLLIFLAYIGYSAGWKDDLDRIQWAYILPLLAFLFLSKRKSIYLCILFIAVIAFILFYPYPKAFSKEFIFPEVLTGFKIRFITSFSIICAIGTGWKYGIERNYSRIVQHQSQLTLSEEKYRQLIENSHDIIHTLTADGIFTFVSPAATVLLGYPVDQVIGQSIFSFIHPEDMPECLTLLQSIIKSGKRQGGAEARVRHLDGSWRWCTSNSVPLIDASGKVLGIEGIISVIDDRKQSEHRIKSLLSEKELLLKEVHHRIKNNMTTIKGLISLQISAEENPSARQSIQDLESRVQSMMILYENLYCSQNYRELSVKNYLDPLTVEIINNFPNRSIVNIITEIEDFVLNLQKLSPLGIIINEILTNMMKHAFTGKSSGVITVSAKLTDSNVTIVVADNGIGIPESVDFKNSAGFGMQLIGMLTEQMGGSIKIERFEGTKFILEFQVV